MSDTVLAIRVSVPRRIRESPFRLTAMAEDAAVFFEANVPLANNPEGMLSSFLLPAMSAGRPLDCDEPICPLWRMNAGRAAKLVRRWWGLEAGVVTAPDRPAGTRRAAGVGLFFTAGVDSFHSLFANAAVVTHLINVEGFDIHLDDRERLHGNAAQIDDIARVVGKQIVRVRTNLRQHSGFASMSWERTHGAALAGVGHVLTHTLGCVLVASSDVPGPHGSHPQLDPLWSSSLLEVTHDSPGVRRLAKVAAIAKHEIVHTHLKVCWENRARSLNCGRCEKCLRTRLQFLVAGVPHLPAFPEFPLVTGIDELQRAAPHLHNQWRDIAQYTSDPQLRAAIQSLLARSQPPSLVSRAARFARRQVVAAFHGRQGA
jgi:hypothetical protein